MYDLSSAELSEADRIIHNALKEDIRSGDITTNATTPKNAVSHAVIYARSSCILAGITISSRTFTLLDRKSALFFPVSDGSRIKRNQRVFEIHGNSSAILQGERTALNILCRMSGIATLTRKFVDRVEGTGAVILDTRKTMPGLRLFDKYAVRTGGGNNHRYALDDMFLIKENHSAEAGGIARAIKLCKAYKRQHGLRAKIVVEAGSRDEALEAADSGSNRILLDNLLPDEVKAIADILNERVKLEVSGGITLRNVRAFAETGIHYISIGRLTHSAPAADFSLLFI